METMVRYYMRLQTQEGASKGWFLYVEENHGCGLDVWWGNQWLFRGGRLWCDEVWAVRRQERAVGLWTRVWNSVLVLSLFLCASCQLTPEYSASCSVLMEMLLNFRALISSPLPLPLPLPAYSHLLLLWRDQHFLVGAPIPYHTSPLMSPGGDLEPIAYAQQNPAYTTHCKVVGDGWLGLLGRSFKYCQPWLYYLPGAWLSNSLHIWFLLHENFFYREGGGCWEFILCQFLYVFPFNPPDISVKWIFPSIFQVRKLRHRWRSIWSKLTQLCKAEIRV